MLRVITKEALKTIKKLQKADWYHITQGRKSGVEENIKTKIVVGFLEALGYDRDRDMDFEHWVHNKRADIAIKVNNTPKIIIEVKSPEKKLDKYAEQALDYALRKQVKYVILTNGKEFRLYKSFIENIVDPRDRLLIEPIHLQELKKRFEEINKILSRKALVQKTLDHWSEEKAKELRQKITPKRLLEILNQSKHELTKDIQRKIKKAYKHNENFQKKVEQWIENTAGTDKKKKNDWLEKLAEEFAYSFLNKIYFFRISEDKGILKHHHINARLSSKGSLQKGLEKGWNKLVQECFKAVLEYDYHALFDEELFDKIEFSDTVVGEIVSKLAKYNFQTINRDIIGDVYQKHLPDRDRKRLGEFYTPKEIISYILDNIELTVEARIIDPACGSGGFLIEAYEKLKKIYRNSGWKPKLRSIHEEILFHNLFGVDINPFAVHLSAMNLALRDLLNKTDYIHIVKEDSLSGVGLERWMKKKKTDKKHAFPEKYDVIIGNPPYEVIYSGERPKEYEYYKKNYQSAQSNPNLFALFIEKSIPMLKEGGRLGFIVSNSMLTNESCKNLRKMILKNCAIEQIIDLGAGMFEKAIVNTVIIILRKEQSEKKRDNSKIVVANFVKDIASLSELNFKTYKISQKEFMSSKDFKFNLYLADKRFLRIKKTMEKNAEALGKIANIKRGMVLKDKKCRSKNRKNSSWKKVIVGKDVSRYELNYSGNYVHFNKEKCAGGGCWDKSIYTNKEKLIIVLITGGMKYRINAMYDDKKYFVLQNYNNLVMKSFDYSIKYILAIINSTPINYYYEKQYVDKNIKRVQLNSLPIKKIPLDEQFRVVKLVDKIIDANKEKNKSKNKSKIEKINLKIERIGEEIDEIIYEIYGVKKYKKLIEKAVEDHSFSS